MNRMAARRIEAVLVNATVVTMVVWGVALGSSMAANVFKFLVWFVFLPPILVMCSSDLSAKMRRKGPSIPPRLSLLLDVGIACLLAAYGWFWYAALVAIGGMSANAVYQGEPEPVEKEETQ